MFRYGSQMELSLSLARRIVCVIENVTIQYDDTTTKCQLLFNRFSKLRSAHIDSALTDISKFCVCVFGFVIKKELGEVNCVNTLQLRMLFQVVCIACVLQLCLMRLLA